MTDTASSLQAKLNEYYDEIQTIILSRQNPITGLLPASTAVNAHGDYTDAWVRDNVYSILAVWGLAIAHRHHDPDNARTFELDQSVVKLMRGLLAAMMRQSPKVERFKKTQSLLDALHAKYNTRTGDIVVGDDAWGHLQIDATSIYLLMLAQMTQSGLHIIYTIDEVNFVQNLVYYIGRAYRTPDYGIWERGNKSNHGKAELNASSVGMAKAALEAMNGLNLFGVRGSQASVIHVLPDEVARARLTLESLLPRESSSKETDAALLSIIGFPAFAIEDKELVERTRNKVIDQLEGRYGCKRFLRDGHQTVLEDSERLHYEPWELQKFEHIESEWPLFFTYLWLEGLFCEKDDQAEKYQKLLKDILIEDNGYQLLPELFYVPEESIEAERKNPHSQKRIPNENLPLVWAQSLYFLGQMIQDGLIYPSDLDPLNRRLKVGKQREAVVQVALLAEDQELEEILEIHGIPAETPKQVEPVRVRQATQLSRAYSQIGRNEQLALTGRPKRRLRSLTTSRVYRIRDEMVVFLPSFLDQQQFYLTLDYHFLIDQVKSELAYIQRHWNQLGRPVFTLLLTHGMLEVPEQEDKTVVFPALLQLMRELQAGECNGVQVKLGRLNQFILTAGQERMDFLHGFEFTESAVTDTPIREYYLPYRPERSGALSHTQEFTLECETNLEFLLDSLQNSENLYEQVELLHTLVHLQGLDFDTELGDTDQPVTVERLLREVYAKAGSMGVSSPIHWAVVRHAAGLLNMVDISLSDAVTDILVRGKQITVGKSYSEDSLIQQPMSHDEIYDKIAHFCREDVRDRVLTQEILIYLSLLIKSDPQLLDGLLTLRVGYLILLLTSEIAQADSLTQDEAYEQLMQLSPFEVKQHLQQVLASYEGINQTLQQQESLHVKQSEKEIDWIVRPFTPETETEEEIASWYRRRQLQGSITKVPQNFYPDVWRLMEHCKGIIIGDKLERRNRLDSEIILSEMTPGEKNFALRIEHLLNKIGAPEYRQVNIEALVELSAIAERNPDLQVEEYIVLDVLIGHAVRLAWLEKFPERADRYDEYKAAAWHSFYDTSPEDCAGYIVKAFRYLTEFGQVAA
jgi:phosphorylase kinase alpha/beta subunit